jgi:hypothetical protein
VIEMRVVKNRGRDVFVIGPLPLTLPRTCAGRMSGIHHRGWAGYYTRG